MIHTLSKLLIFIALAFSLIIPPVSAQEPEQIFGQIFGEIAKKLIDDAFAGKFDQKNRKARQRPKQSVGRNGVCQVWKNGQLIDQKSCEVRRKCYFNRKCATTFFWPSGSKTVITTVGRRVTSINGRGIRAVVVNGQHCTQNRYSGNTFCFIKAVQPSPAVVTASKVPVEDHNVDPFQRTPVQHQQIIDQNGVVHNLNAYIGTLGKIKVGIVLERGLLAKFTAHDLKYESKGIITGRFKPKRNSQTTTERVIKYGLTDPRIYTKGRPWNEQLHFICRFKYDDIPNLKDGDTIVVRAVKSQLSLLPIYDFGTWDTGVNLDCTPVDPSTLKTVSMAPKSNDVPTKTTDSDLEKLIDEYLAANEDKNDSEEMRKKRCALGAKLTLNYSKELEADILDLILGQLKQDKCF